MQYKANPYWLSNQIEMQNKANALLGIKPKWRRKRKPPKREKSWADRVRAGEIEPDDSTEPPFQATHEYEPVKPVKRRGLMDYHVEALDALSWNDSEEGTPNA